MWPEVDLYFVLLIYRKCYFKSVTIWFLSLPYLGFDTGSSLHVRAAYAQKMLKEDKEVREDFYTRQYSYSQGLSISVKHWAEVMFRWAIRAHHNAQWRKAIANHFILVYMDTFQTNNFVEVSGVETSLSGWRLCIN